MDSHNLLAAALALAGGGDLVSCQASLRYRCNRQTKRKRMKTLPLFAASTAFVIMAVPWNTSLGQDPDWKQPGTEEAAAVAKADKQIDVVYKQLMSKLDTEGQKSLKDAQRSWIKWRDHEALFIARVGGAIGGSSLRVDLMTAQAHLIRERTGILKAHLERLAND